MIVRHPNRLLLVAALLAPAGPAAAQGEDADDGWGDDDEEEPEGGVRVESSVDPRDAAETRTGDAQKGFVKGELAAVGRIQLISRYHRIGLELGAAGFGQDLYAHLNPVLDLNFPASNLRLGVGVPLNFFAFQGDQGVDKAFGRAGELRKEDWDEPSDWLQWIRHATYGGKEQPFFLSISQVDSRTIGHGPVMRRYVANLDVNRHRVGGEFDAYNDYGGFEVQANDLSGPNIIGMLGFLKPGRFLGDGRPLKRLSVGAHYTTDLAAPAALKCFPHVRFEDPINGDHCAEATRRGFFEVPTDDETGEPIYTRPEVLAREAIHFVGFDVEFKPVRTETADLKPYLDFTKMLGEGAGVTLGALGRFNLGRTKHSAFRVRLEGRSFDANYIPSYFDILYEVDRNVSMQAINADNNAITKLAYLRSQRGEPRRWGVYAEATYALRRWFALTAAWEQATADASKSLLLHLELPASKWFTLFFTYVKRNFESFDSNPFDFRRTDLSTSDDVDIADELFFWAFRIKLLPVLAINWRSQKAFEIRGTAPRFQDVFHFVANIELGYEF